MPRYTKGKGKLQRKRKWKGFEGVGHMTQWLTKTPRNHPIWKKHFQDVAQNYKQEAPFFHTRSLRKVATKPPVKLAGDVLSELKRYRRGKPVGGGISELLHWMGNEAAQITGFNSFREFVGQGYVHKKIPHEAQVFAKAVDATYLDVSKRPAELEGLMRLTEYDNPRFSVWLEPNGQYLVSIHGTKANWHDVGQDAGIAVGAKMNSPEVQALFTRLDREGATYDIASHSLATQYVANSTHQNSDKIYMYNLASSPLYSSDYLTKLANNDEYTYFMNPSDAVSEAAWQKMKPDTVEKSYIAPYQYSQFSAHSIGAWYPDLEAPEERTDQPSEQQQRDNQLRDSSVKFRQFAGLDS